MRATDPRGSRHWVASIPTLEVVVANVDFTLILGSDWVLALVTTWFARLGRRNQRGMTMMAVKSTCSEATTTEVHRWCTIQVKPACANQARRVLLSVSPTSGSSVRRWSAVRVRRVNAPPPAIDLHRSHGNACRCCTCTCRCTGEEGAAWKVGHVHVCTSSYDKQEIARNYHRGLMLWKSERSGHAVASARKLETGWSDDGRLP